MTGPGWRLVGVGIVFIYAAVGVTYSHVLWGWW